MEKDLKSNKRELEAQISRLEADRESVRKWVKGEELKVDKFKEQSRKTLDEIHAEKGLLSERKTQVQEILTESSKKDAEISKKLSKLEIEKEMLARDKSNFMVFKRSQESDIARKAQSIESKVDKVNEKEKWVKKVFSEFERLNNDSIL